MTVSSKGGPYGWQEEGREAPLDELLADPATADLMRADGVTVEDIWAVISCARRNLDVSSCQSTLETCRDDEACEPVGQAWLREIALLDDDAFRELGIRPDQIVALRNMGPASVDELGRMTARAGLDVERTPLPVRIDLHLNCAGCMERGLCRSWLNSGNKGIGYRVFCPNSRMLDRLLQVQRWRGRSIVPSS